MWLGSGKALEDTGRARVASGRETKQVLAREGLCLCGAADLVREEHLSSQRLRGVGAARRERQVLVVPDDGLGPRLVRRSAFAQLLGPSQEEEGVERTRRVREPTTLRQQSGPGQVRAPSIPGGVGDGEQVLAGR